MWFWCHSRWRVAAHWANCLLIFLLEGKHFGLRSSYEKKSKINLVPVEGAARELAVPLHPETAAVVAGHQPVRGVAGRHRPVAAWCQKLFREGGG